MNTTSIVIEHLVIGFQALTWIILSICSVFGYQWINREWLVSDATVVIVALLLVYPVGVFLDEAADWCFKPLSKRLRKKHGLAEKQTVYQLLIILQNDSTTQYFQYLRSRIRIARSSTINFLLITIASVLFTKSQLKFQLGSEINTLIVCEISIGIVLTLLAFGAAWRMNETFAKRIKWGYDTETVKKKSRAPDSKRRRVTNI